MRNILEFINRFLEESDLEGAASSLIADAVITAVHQWEFTQA